MKQHVLHNIALTTVGVLCAMAIPLCLNFANQPDNINKELFFALTGAVLLATISGFVAQFFSLQSMLDRAKVDPLTKLLSRVSFNEKFEEVLKHAAETNQVFHMLLIDLNNFKQVNDTVGYDVGDNLLAVVAQRLEKATKLGDVIGRLGDDEFAILVIDPENNNAYKKVVNQIISSVNITTGVGNTSTYISTSIGVASYPVNGNTVNEITRRANIAMNVAKKTKQDCCVFKDEDDHFSIGEFTLVGEIREAIENDNFDVWFQPKVSTVTGCVESAECLIRWIHPVRGIILPDVFIPHAETTGIIRHLNQIVFEKASQSYKMLKEAGFNISMAVNISPTNIIDPNLITTIVKHIVPAGMDPAKLTLEITETAFMHDTNTAVKVLSALDSLGARLSIDDFGMGYASLLYLKNFPINEIKLDKSFVTDIDTNSIGHNIVKATINLAHELSIKVVAEGVETMPVVGALTELNCDFIQGYYVAVPMPINTFIDWLSNTDYKVATE